MSSSSAKDADVPYFKGDNYNLWALMMKTMFRSKDLWKLVEKGFSEEGDTIRINESLKKDAKAMEFYAVNMKQRECVQDFITRVLDIGYQIRIMKEALPQKTVISKILRSLTPRFSLIVHSIIEAKDLNTLTVEQLSSSLKHHESILNIEDGHHEEERALHVGRISTQFGDHPHRGGRGEMKLFESLEATPTQSIRLGDGKSLQVEGVGYEVKFSGGECIITEANTKVKRYGHMNMRRLKHLSKNNMVLNLPIITDEYPCEACALGKQTLVGFPKKVTRRATTPMELIHADLVGPMNTPSIGGNTYFLLLTDDYSRFSWLKSNTFFRSRSFTVIAEANSLPMNSSHSGQAAGILHQPTVTRTPEQNGVAERKNKTVTEMAQTLLKEKSMLSEYWAEAVATAVHILNCSLTKVVEHQPPFEVLTGSKPSVDHFRVFGCLVYCYVDSQMRTKFDAKSFPAILIGYSDHSKAYKTMRRHVIVTCIQLMEIGLNLCRPHILMNDWIHNMLSTLPPVNSFSKQEKKKEKNLRRDPVTYNEAVKDEE
ncbi:uncharacterized protein LOC120253896 [Dioscorea cayenensis subsp. rotundata]|uniref:Uncharacterized protein LOC120253896 n=1 Tax=Dioscorea cayennensis subsp. rotundata TaxID=55577 RepID=A0AB40ATU4_DIOCR|nr:uncharacterized protein LOC120253896 [Dioscorea cayenensis subsp. rotundata]